MTSNLEIMLQQNFSHFLKSITIYWSSFPLFNVSLLVNYISNYNRYKNEFGFTLSGRDVLVDDVRVRGIGKSVVAEEKVLPSGKGVKPTVEKVGIVVYSSKNCVSM